MKRKSGCGGEAPQPTPPVRDVKAASLTEQKRVHIGRGGRMADFLPERDTEHVERRSGRKYDVPDLMSSPKTVVQEKPYAGESAHDYKNCRQYRCGICAALGIKDARRGLK